MSSTLYTSGTVVTSNWLNDADTATYNYLTAVAGTNAITATGPVSMLSYTAGDRFYLKPAITNTGATTINISGLGVQPITKNGSSNLVAGDLVVGHVYEIVYDGSFFQLINPSTFNGTQTVPAANITGQVAVANGGTGASTAVGARTNLGAANSGANSDITSLSGLTTALSVAQGGTGDTGTAWTSGATGAITATSGSIAAASGVRRTKSLGKTVFFSATITITNNGTGATGMNVAAIFPTAPISDVIVMGRETQSSGEIIQLVVAASSTTGALFSSTNTYPGVTGAVFKFNGCYESV